MPNPFGGQLTQLGEADLILARTVAGLDPQLTTFEKKAFRAMARELEEGKREELTHNQRDWLTRVSYNVEAHTMDRALLNAVLEESDLSEYEENAFADMLAKLAPATPEKPRKVLTELQRQLLEKVADRLGLKFEPRPSGNTPRPVALRQAPVPEGLPRSERLLPWERPGYTKPVKPPGRV